MDKKAGAWEKRDEKSAELLERLRRTDPHAWGEVIEKVLNRQAEQILGLWAVVIVLGLKAAWDLLGWLDELVTGH